MRGNCLLPSIKLVVEKCSTNLHCVTVRLSLAHLVCLKINVNELPMCAEQGGFTQHPTSAFYWTVRSGPVFPGNAQRLRFLVFTLLTMGPLR